HLLRTGRTAAASNVYLVGSGGTWVLVDAGWPGSAGAITAAAKEVSGPGKPPAPVLLTHIHPDHPGADRALVETKDVPVYVHPSELPMAAGRYLPEYGMPLDRWVIMPVMRLLPRRTRSRIEDAGSLTHVVHPLEPDGTVPGLPGWRWVATPGHTPGHVA